MLMLAFTDEAGWFQNLPVISTFRDAHGREFAIVPRDRGLYDNEPPFAIKEISEDTIFYTQE